MTDLSLENEIGKITTELGRKQRPVVKLQEDREPERALTISELLDRIQADSGTIRGMLHRMHSGNKFTIGGD